MNKTIISKDRKEYLRKIKTKSIINKEDIETKYGIVTYNPNKPNKKGND